MRLDAAPWMVGDPARASPAATPGTDKKPFSLLVETKFQLDWRPTIFTYPKVVSFRRYLSSLHNECVAAGHRRNSTQETRRATNTAEGAWNGRGRGGGIRNAASGHFI